MRICCIVLLILMFGQAQASECRRLFYEEENRKEALQPCLKEEMYFQVAYIYGSELQNCSLMTKYYLISGDPMAIGNLGLGLLYGHYGCEKSVAAGLTHLKSSVEDGGTGFANILGNYYKDQGNKKVAKDYYIKSTRLNGTVSDFNKARSDRSLEALISLLSYDEKIQLLIDKQLGGMAHCKLGNNLLNWNTDILMADLSKKRSLEKFMNSLCNDQKLYFKGSMYESGLGETEDFREAYRHYLLAGAAGNLMAKEARDRIRDKISLEKVEQATCVAAHGLEPNLYEKWKCNW